MSGEAESSISLTTDQVKCGARDCSNGLWKGKAKYTCYTCKGTGKVTSKLTDKSLTNSIALLKSNIDQLSDRSKSFAESLIKQAERKGSLSPKQMPYLDSLIADAVKSASRPKPVATPKPVNENFTVSGFEAVTEMMTATHDNGLQICRLRLHTPKGQIVFKSATRSVRTGGWGTPATRVMNEYIKVEMNGVELGAINRDTSVAGFRTLQGRRFTHYKSVESDIDAFRQDPIGVMTAMGKKTGNCCFCGRDLTDNRSTAHGYGPVCAKRYSLAWNTDSAMVIEEAISERTEEARIVHDIINGVWNVVDSDDATILATFTSASDARRFVDEFSTIEKVA
tara:strand:- start:4253 stop:5266 length:1014 start_codon:yes stop_codon:yes gene_type:complete